MDNKKTLGQKIFYSSLAKIIIGLIACVVTVLAGQAGIEKLLDLTSLNPEFRDLIKASVVSILLLVVYSSLYRAYEKRKITELSSVSLAKNLITGILLGTILQSLTVFVIYLNKGFFVISVNNFIYVLPFLATAFGVAIIEETLFRGIIFRITEEKLGSYLALAISAFIFGALHLANPHSSLAGATSVAIEAGLLLGAAFIYSKNLWFPIAIHFAWNFTQSGIYGAATSGHIISKSLLTTRIEGPDFITGGEFGPEGSVQAVLFCLIAAIVLMVLSHRQDKIIRPYWSKKSKK
jgi:membrane protease YdiL (CAAX protease family)